MTPDRYPSCAGVIVCVFALMFPVNVVVLENELVEVNALALASFAQVPIWV